MSPVAIPPWIADGVLPPINASQPVPPERSPYVVSLTDYVLRFGDTAERRTILDGSLRYRAALHGAGVVQGFQWLDGSFLEHVEVTEGRAPHDVDVVTFYRLPPGLSQAQLAAKAGALLAHASVKTTFRVDGYLVHLGKVLADNEAVCTVQFGESIVNLSDVGQVRTSIERLSQENLREEPEELRGELQRVLPKARVFELKLAESSQVIRGKISPNVDDPGAFNRELHRPTVIKVMVTRVGGGRPRYLLLEGPAAL